MHAALDAIIKINIVGTAGHINYIHDAGVKG